MANNNGESDGFDIRTDETAALGDITGSRSQKFRYMLDHIRASNSEHQSVIMYLPESPFEVYDDDEDYNDEASYDCDKSDNYDSDNYSDNNEIPSSDTYCGFRKAFLEENYRCWRDLKVGHFGIGMDLTAEEAEKNAKELVDEEERVKQKAEKRRLKKKRQKERKRKEKLEKENNEIDKKMQNLKLNSGIKENICKKCDNLSVKTATASSDKSRKETGKCNDESKDEIFIEESEGELDMTSSFVSKAASIAKRKLELQELKHKTERKKNYINNTIQEVEVKQSSQEISGDMGPDVISRSLELGNIGNQLANTGRFDLAIKYFTDAIKLNPKEFKFFGNRSFCYERLQQYDRALSDAEICISICPSWTKGSFRKGRALIGLKRLAEAAIAFKEVLKLDNTSQDAAEELMNVQIFQLMEMGFSREQSANALIIHGTVQKALEALSTLSDAGIMQKDSCFKNDCSGAAEEQWILAKRKTPVVLKSASCNIQTSSISLKSALNPKVDSASSPQAQKPCLELYPVWVGNVTNCVSEIILRKVFSSVGEIHSIRMLHSRRCAFVNYKESKGAELAIKTLQGLEIYDAKLLVRPPDHSYKNLGGANISTVIPKVSDPTTTVSASQKSVRARPSFLDV